MPLFFIVCTMVVFLMIICLPIFALCVELSLFLFGGSPIILKFDCDCPVYQYFPIKTVGVE